MRDMTLEEKLEKIIAVNLFQLDFDNNVSMRVFNISPRVARDYVRYQSIERTGWAYAPTDKERIDLAKWFINRRCTVTFMLNPNKEINWLQKLIAIKDAAWLTLLVWRRILSGI